MSYGYRSSWRNRSSAPWVLGGLVVLVLLVAIIPLYHSYKQEHVVRTTICGKEAVPTGNSGHEYRVYTSDGTFKVTDHVVNGARFSSADTYGRIRPGKVYDLKVYGWRIGILSKFKNIEQATLVPSATASSCD
jgi:hypothetical protein